MIFEQTCKVVKSVPYFHSTSTASTAVALTVDTLGYNYCLLDVAHGTVATNATHNWTALTVYEHDTTTFATTLTVVAGTTNTTASAGQFVMTGFTPATDGTAAMGITRIGVVCGGVRRRYLSVVPVAGAACTSTAGGSVANIVVTAHLFRAKQAGDSAADMGVQNYTFV